MLSLQCFKNSDGIQSIPGDLLLCNVFIEAFISSTMKLLFNISYSTGHMAGGMLFFSFCRYWIASISYL